MLKNSLDRLDRMIGMDRVKDMVITQLIYFLSHSPSPTDMVHTLITGPPGVGKTELGKILADCWTAMGLIKVRPATKPRLEDELERERLLSGMCRYFLDQVHSKSKTVGDRLRDHHHDLKAIRRLPSSKVREMIKEFGSIRDLMTEIQEHSTKFDVKIAPKALPPVASSTFRFASREDFVAGYLGQTAIKTQTLLNECRGKILFIDEAYSLINDEKDSFGMEALTTLNLFMSEHPDEIIVIFAGYQDLINKTIFKYQPGLRRRCNWTFDITNYTASDLSQIFVTQLTRENFELAEGVDLVEFFTSRLDKFPAFGGDTHRLIFQCKLEYCRVAFPRIETSRVITSKVLMGGYERYLQNTVLKDVQHDLPPPDHMYT